MSSVSDEESSLSEQSLFCCCPRQRKKREKDKKGLSGPSSNKEVIELLLLGTENSGKSTFLRQMQVIHGSGFDNEKRYEYRPNIYQNVFDDMDILIYQIQRMSIKFEYEDSASFLEEYKQSRDTQVKLKAAKFLWQDMGIKKCFEHRFKYETTHRISTCAEYFLDALDRISEEGYLPETEDIIKMRNTTKGVTSVTKFEIKRAEFHIRDVGGGREERLRWVQLFQNKTMFVVYIVALDEFDSYFKVEGDKRLHNRLQESINVFKDIMENQWMEHTTFILFLNKVDVFRKKIKHSNISAHFPKFQGFSNNENDVQNFIKDQFHMIAKSRGRDMYHHITQATDKNNIRVIFDVVRNTILQMHFDMLGLISK